MSLPSTRRKQGSEFYNHAPSVFNTTSDKSRVPDGAIKPLIYSRPGRIYPADDDYHSFLQRGDFNLTFITNWAPACFNAAAAPINFNTTLKKTQNTLMSVFEVTESDDALLTN